MLLKWKFVRAVVCFSVGAGNLSWEETVVQGLGEAEFCGSNQVCSHSKNPSACRICLPLSQLTNPSTWLNKHGQIYLQVPVLVLCFLPPRESGELFCFLKL